MEIFSFQISLHVLFLNFETLMYDWLLIVLISKCCKVTWGFPKVTPVTALEPYLSSQHQRMASYFENGFHTHCHTVTDEAGVAVCHVLIDSSDIYLSALHETNFLFLTHQKNTVIARAVHMIVFKEHWKLQIFRLDILCARCRNFCQTQPVAGKVCL